MNTCLVSCNELVNFAARSGILFQRMASPMCRNAQWCCDTVGLSLYNMHGINNDLVFPRVHKLIAINCNMVLKRTAVQAMLSLASVNLCGTLRPKVVRFTVYHWMPVRHLIG